MLQVYLPIIKISVSIVKVLMVGFGGGVFSATFGVGAGFFTIPIMMMMGVPASAAIVSSNGQVMSASLSALVNHWKRGNVDVGFGAVLLTGLSVGMVAGSRVFVILQDLGQTDMLISISYVLILSTIGSFMFKESAIAVYAKHRGINLVNKSSNKGLVLINKMPLKVSFKRSGITLSIITPLLISFFAGFVMSVSGISTNFIMIPSMVYLFRVPSMIVVGTAFFTSTCISMLITFNQSIDLHNVDMIFLFFLMIGSITGSNTGIKLAGKLSPEEMRLLLSIIMFIVSFRLLWTIMRTPEYNYILLDL